MLLDNDQDKISITKAEDILWQASPAPNYDEIWSRDSLYASYYKAILLVGIVGIGYLYQNYEPQYCLTLALCLLPLIALQIYVLDKYKKETKFYILKDGIFIKYLDELLKPKEQFLPFENIEKAWFYPKNPDGNKSFGSVEIILKPDAQFEYFNYNSRTYIENPILHDIDNIDKVHQIIYDNLKR